MREAGLQEFASDSVAIPTDCDQEPVTSATEPVSSNVLSADCDQRSVKQNCFFRVPQATELSAPLAPSESSEQSENIVFVET